MFTVNGNSYDRFMGRYSSRLAAKFADFAGVGSDSRILDVGCGPGALTAELVGRVGASNVAAIDPSQPFVAAVSERIPDIEVHRATAESLPFESGAFDAALAQLVVHFMTDPVAGLSEMKRVTKPGGVVAACVWDHAGGRGPLENFWKVARALDVGINNGAEKAGTSEGHLAQLFAAAGLAHVVDSSLLVEVVHETFEEWWEPYTLGVGPAGVYLSGLSNDGQGDLRDRCRAIVGPGPISISAVAWVAKGVA
jgi:SAM-dependent methyltransferase